MQEFLKQNNLDYIIINSTNKFLVEYNVLEENSRYYLTGFTGSTGDALVSRNGNIYLFVDGRYHEQADRECDLEKITVVKLQQNQSFLEEVSKLISTNSTLGIIGEKTSVYRYECLKTALTEKNVEIKILEKDVYTKEKLKQNKKNLELIDRKICGKSAKEKINYVQNLLKDNEAYLFTNLEETSYITNLRDFSKAYSTAINGKVLITKSSATLFCDDDTKTAELIIKPLKEFQNSLNGLNKIYFDKISTNMADYLLFKDIATNMETNPILKMKSVKTEEELKHYKECFRRTDKAVFEIREYINNNENISEKNIDEELEKAFKKHGAKLLSFKSIVAKDTNAALAHYSKSSEKEILKDGSLVLIDCGAYYEGGYATDITRVFVKGTPTEEQRKIYTLVLKSSLAAFNTKITDKTTGYDIDKAARDLLSKIAPKGFEFSHGLGHGIGISVHEQPPRLSPAISSVTQTPIEDNMCFTIEPGLYYKNFGGVRLENSVYMKNRKIHSFSKMCYEQKLIDFDLLSDKEKEQLKDFEVM